MTETSRFELSPLSDYSFGISTLQSIVKLYRAERMGTPYNPRVDGIISTARLEGRNDLISEFEKDYYISSCQSTNVSVDLITAHLSGQKPSPFVSASFSLEVCQNYFARNGEDIFELSVPAWRVIRPPILRQRTGVEPLEVLIFDRLEPKEVVGLVR